LRDWLALIVLAFLGFVLFWVGIKVIRPARSQVSVNKTVSAKLLGATPDALRNYQMLLEGKIARDPQKYARALLRLQNDRALYPEGHLPSPELTAAIALIYLPADELDERADWRQLLQRLPAEARQHGLSLVAYELSRVFSARRQLLELGPIHQGKPAKSKSLKETASELSMILERLVRVVPKSDPEEKVLHGLLLSRVLSLTLVSALEYPQIFSSQTIFRDSLGKIPDLHPFLGTSDKLIITELARIVSLKLSKPSIPIAWDKSLAGLLDANSQTSFMCQLNETGAGADALLFFLSQAVSSKQSVPEVAALFDSCFVGLRLYPRLSAQSVLSGFSPVTEFAGSGPADEVLLKRFRKSFPTFSPLLARLGGAKNPMGEWMLVLYRNGILAGKITSVGGKAQEKICGKSMIAHSMCIQTRWTEAAGKWRDLVPLVVELRDDIKPQDLVFLGQNFLFNAAKEALLAGGVKKNKEIFEAMRAVRDLVDPEDPQIQFLLDYVQSLGTET
jgi:hypothetical protein